MMTANILGTVSTVLLALAALLVVTAIAMFFMLDIRAVRDELIGRTAERAIATMRSESWAVRRNRERSARALTADGPDAPEGEDSGSLHLRRVTTPRNVRVEDETGTTLLSKTGTGTGATTNDDETGTTLLSTGDTNADEAGTTLLADTGSEASSDETGTSLLADDESMTTLLPDQPSHEEDAQ